MPYSPTTWVNGSSPPISAANLNHLELALKAAYPIYNVLDSAYGAVGNGSTDDTTALQAAITAAQATGGLVYSPPGYTYLISSALSLSAACWVDFEGSTIKKAATFPNTLSASGAALNMSGNNIVVRNVVIDGNRSGGAGGGGTWSSGTGCRMDRVVVNHCNWHGLVCGGGTLDAVYCEATDNGPAASNVNGIVCFAGVLRTYDCYAASNAYYGFYFDSSASDGCRLEGRTFQNTYGALILNNNGHCPFLRCSDDTLFGLQVGTTGTVSNWTFDYVEADLIGQTGTTGTGIELYAASHCTFGTIVSTRHTGYGLSVSQNTSLVGSSYNVFHSVTCDHTGGTDGDPGITVNGGSSFNSFGNVMIIGHSVAITVGEQTTGNNDNVFGNVLLIGNGYGGITIDGGFRNTFVNVVSRNTFTADLHTIESKGVLTFISADAQYNVVGFLDHKDTGTDMTSVPGALVWADSATKNNSVLDGYNRDSMVGAQDGNGSNYFYLRRPFRRTVISTFDSGETWTNSTNNTTNGQFVEGNGGKKVTGAVSNYTTSVHSLTIDLSAMADSDFFRMWCYITNQADMVPGGGAISMEMHSASGAYFFGWQASILKDGGQWLSVRKGGAPTSGTPNWAAITSINLLVWGTAGTSTATFDNLHIAETQWDRLSNIGQNNTPAAITVGASPFLYQNTDGIPLNVMVSGGTVSAIDYSQDASTFYSQGQTSGIFIVNPGDYTRVTYTVAPTMTKVPTR